MQPLAEQLIVDILQTEMGLSPDQIWIRDQNKVFPNTEGLFIIAGMVDSTIMASVNTAIPTDAGMNEIQQVNSCDYIQIDILSRNTDAVFRRWEVVAALRSIYSEQLQEINNFKIFAIPRSFLNTASAEGGSQINRFSITIPCHVWYRKEKVLESRLGDYFDKFSTRVDDEATIGTDHGIIEFTEPPS